METDLDNIIKWCNLNGLKNNRDKTQVLSVCTSQNRKNIPSEISLSFNGVKLAFVKEAKNLGVVIDNQMNFKPHLDHISRKCKKELCALKRAKQCLPKRTLIKTIETTIFPKLFYAAPVIQAAPKSYIEDTLVRAVNFGAKLVFGLRKYDRASESRRKLGWLDAHSELRKRTEMMAYKAYTNHDYLDLTHPIMASTARTSARLNKLPKFHVPSFHSEVAKRSVSYRAPHLLNDICAVMDINVIDSPPTVKEFKLLLKKCYSTV